MNSLLILIPVTLLIVLLATAVFFWAVSHQQFDDLDSPGFVPLLEEPPQGDAGPDMPGAPRTQACQRAFAAAIPGPRAALPPTPLSNPDSRTTRSIS